MGLIEYSSIGISSINRKSGRGIACFHTTGAQAHILQEGAAIGVELAFGQHSHLYFALTIPLARKLTDDLSQQVEGSASSAAKKQPH